MQKRQSLELGFATFFLNRTNRSGIIKGGPIGGMDQRGNYKINCRFNKTDLIKKIRCISLYKNRIYLYNNDAVHFIQKVLPTFSEDKLFIFFDPLISSKEKIFILTFMIMMIIKNFAMR